MKTKIDIFSSHMTIEQLNDVIIREPGLIMSMKGFFKAGEKNSGKAYRDWLRFFHKNPKQFFESYIREYDIQIRICADMVYKSYKLYNLDYIMYHDIFMYFVYDILIVNPNQKNFHF